MTVFIAIAALLTLLVVAWVVRPLLRPAARAGVSSQRLNVAICRDQLQALECDLARGVISPADHETTRDELQLRLLDDTASPEPVPQTGRTTFWTARRTAGAMAVLFPLASAAMYGWLGNPAAMAPLTAQEPGDAQIVQMVESLAARLEASPDDPQGWALLARSYNAMERFDDAEQVFLKAGALVDTDPDLLTQYADLLATRAGNDLEGRPLALVNKALALNPEHPVALMMAGSAAYRRADHAQAVIHWEKALTVLEPGSRNASLVAAEIAVARAKGGAGLPSAPMR